MFNCRVVEASILRRKYENAFRLHRRYLRKIYIIHFNLLYNPVVRSVFPTCWSTLISFAVIITSYVIFFFKKSETKMNNLLNDF